MAKKKRKKAPKEGIAHIHTTFNNTIITITDKEGNTICWASGGSIGLKGTKKGTPFAAGMAATRVAKEAIRLGMKKVEVWIKGPGHGRETAVRALRAAGLDITCFRDVTPIPHNGCRPPKRRSV
mgnify:CR=1 FL=1